MSTLHALSRGWRRYNLNEIPSLVSGNSGYPVSSNAGTLWATQVVTNGGAQPSASLITAITNFWDSLVTAGIDTKMLTVNVMAPGGLIPVCTPITLNRTGSALWTNFSFTAADVTTNGLVGNGTKWLNSNLNCNFQDANNNGLTAVLSARGSGMEGSNYCIMGSWQNATSRGWSYQPAPTADGHIYFDDFYNDTRLALSYTHKLGYHSGNRTANNDCRVFYGNNTSSLAQLGSTATTAPGVIPSASLAFFCQKYDTATIGTILDGTLSFIAIHKGLSLTEETSLFNAVKTLRNAIGGGWV